MKYTRSFVRGFTLVELMVAIAIMALLTGIIVTNLSGSKAKSRDARRVSDVGQIGLALELYFDRCKAYPPAPLATTASNGACSALGITLATYIAQIPKDPSTAADYGYAVKSDNTDYVLHAAMEGTSEVVKSGLNQTAAPAWFTSVSPAPFVCYDSSHTSDYCLGAR